MPSRQTQKDLPLNPAKLRSHFPAFEEPSLRDWAFFENAGGAYPCRQVIDRLNDYYLTKKVQPYSPYPASSEAGQAMDLAYARLAAALNVPVDAVHFGPSTSANTYMLAHALAGHIRPNSAIVVTNQDHEANSGAWRRLAAEGHEIREWKVNSSTGRLDPDDLEELLDDKVAFVAFPHVSNIVGEINPANQICARLREAGILSIVDGVAYAPHGLPDLGNLGADIYLFSAYKTYGPHLGVMMIRPELGRVLANQGHYFNDRFLRKRLTIAGPDHAQIAAAAGIVDYLEAVAGLAADQTGDATPFRRAHTAMRAQETMLMAPLLNYLTDRNDIRLVGPAEPESRAPTISVIADRPGGEIAKGLAQHGIMASGGHFYAVRLMEAMGIDPDHGVLRLSFLHYTEPEEIERLIAALEVELA
ncbi:aminotransferase class V-fold PLP-dependent enzyme [Cucumibacter marinus]|uniref:aminotransferase class V-fold PLP-dependent enzyme n=1 Tax=Cucumibacter marinus TaxID=1121252 RepID=UPI000426E672|nr:aminotransferase class V-fold PLP-dependent enzyme [Cucumibacter marinus]